MNGGLHKTAGSGNCSSSSSCYSSNITTRNNDGDSGGGGDVSDRGYFYLCVIKKLKNVIVTPYAINETCSVLFVKVPIKTCKETDKGLLSLKHVADLETSILDVGYISWKSNLIRHAASQSFSEVELSMSRRCKFPPMDLGSEGVFSQLKTDDMHTSYVSHQMQ
ncbi:hypothetical protein FF38_08409 [Lucilia cuprina]|uniref:Uncharacterized protein n=1 Tax=Lucilia cuprina TaxID=7375 RepID=A0A0L0BMS8_LUCCU|nr:hypothetical protein FF38_08409 [Lucilia cuprina]